MRTAPTPLLLALSAAVIGALASLGGSSTAPSSPVEPGPIPSGATTAVWPAGLETGPVVVAIDDARGTLRAAIAGVDEAPAAGLRWAAGSLEAGRELGIVTAPHLLLVGRGADGAPAVLDACEPVGAARPEAAAVRRALDRFAAPDGAGRIAGLRARVAGDPGDAEAALDLVTALEAAGDLRGAEEALAGALARERSTVGPVHRFAEWRALLREGEGLADDPRATLRAALKKEASKRVLNRGWGLIATIQADRLERAEGDDGRRKARTWLLEATREAYQRCPDRDLVPMLEVIVERFAEDPGAVDVMDRYFLRGRVNQLARLAPDSPWVEVGRELIGPR